MNTKSNIKTLLILALVVLLSSNSNIAQNVGIGSNSFTPDASAGLEIRYSDKGVLIPNVNIADLSTAAPVTSPAVSLLVYNTNETTGEGFYYWNGVAWISIGGTCITPIVPTEGTNIAKYYQITWNWIPSSDAPTFFKYNTVNDYNSAISTAGNNSLIMENLNCGQTYTIYVWAYNSCGNSTSLTLTQSTLECPIICGTSTVTFTYKGTPVTYGTAVGQNGTCWLDRNLGATQVATSSTDAASYGDLFQWGRLDDGHQNRTSSTFQWDSENDVPGHSSFIISTAGGTQDWRSPKNDNLWQGGDGINNPCPTGWRVPTEAEWTDEESSWTGNSASAFASPLKLPMGGRRIICCGSDAGTLNSVGSIGRYWSSTVDGNNARSFSFTSSNKYWGNEARKAGHSVRCIKD